jgi:D-lactate dehydrogenase
MKIAFFEIKPQEKIFFETHLKNHKLFFFEATVNDVLQTQEDYDAISIFIHSHIHDEILEKLPNLKYLQTRSTGYDHIKCDMLYARGLLLSNVAGYGGPAVAEFAFSLLLNASRHTHVALARTKKRDFEYSDLKGIELHGKTLGILGLGTIGSQMARIGRGFGMQILAYSRTKKEIVDELHIDFCDLDTLLTKSDIVMIALPLNPATRTLLNQNNMHKLKKECIIVNTARGEIIEDVLYGKMKNILCLDVISNTKYIHRDNILYTPHMAYYTEEALERIQRISLENMLAFIEKKPLPNCLKLACKRDNTIKNEISKDSK